MNSPAILASRSSLSDLIAFGGFGLDKAKAHHATVEQSHNPPFTSRQLSLRNTAAHGASASQARTGIGMGALLGVPLMLGFGYTLVGDAVPLVGALTMSAS